jgi:hypothetical protein
MSQRVDAAEKNWMVRQEVVANTIRASKTGKQ